MAKTKQELHPEDRMLALWYQDEFWYPATVRQIGSATNIYMQFDDGDKQWTAQEDILAMDIEAGDRVHVKWEDGEYYPAHVLDIKKGHAKATPVQVQFEDENQKEDTTLQMLRVTR